MSSLNWRRSFVILSVTAVGLGLVLTVAGTVSNAGVGTHQSLIGRLLSAAIPGRDRAEEVSASETHLGDMISSEWTARVRDGGRILLGTHQFDPLKEDVLPANLPGPRASTPAGPSRLGLGYYVVQADGKITDEFRARIAEAGGEILSYIPNNAYLVRAAGGGADQIRAWSGTRWVGSWLAEYRVAPDLLSMIGRGTQELPLDSRGNVWVRVALFRGELLADYAAEIQGAVPGIEVLDSYDPKDSGVAGDEDLNARILVSVPPDVLEPFLQVAGRLGGVQYVDHSPQQVLFNDYVAPYMQNGSLNVFLDNQPLYRNAIYGQTEIVTVADDGAESDICFFRYSSDAGDVTACINYPATNNPPVPPANQLSPCNKIIACYIQTAAVAGDPIQHGTHVLGNMAGDNYSYLAARTDRSDPACPVRVQDDPNLDQAPNTIYGTKVDFHQAKDSIAPGAQAIVQDLGDASGNLVPGASNNSALINQAYLTGSRFHNASYGAANPVSSYEIGQNDVDFRHLRYRDFLHFRAAGNGGPDLNTLGGGEAASKNAVVVGATDAADPLYPGGTRDPLNVDPTSSVGPTYDGRLKPDVVAPGSNFSAESRNPGPGNNECDTAPSQGTSFASPVIAGTTALIANYFKDGFYPTGVRTRTEGSAVGDTTDPGSGDSMIPTNALLKAVLINSSVTRAGGNYINPRPSDSQGWGLPILDNTLFFSGDSRRLLVITDTPNGLSSTTSINDHRPRILQGFSAGVRQNQVKTFPLNVIGGSDLIVTMCWTDPPTGLGAGTALVNDLDLEIEGPDPENPATFLVWRPRPSPQLWTGGYVDRTHLAEPRLRQSATPPFVDPVDADRLNNCEQIAIRSSDLVPNRTYTLRVVGFSVPGSGSSCSLCARPNFIDTDASTQADDLDDTSQGFALIASGAFTTTQGVASFNKATFTCGGDKGRVSVNDQNGDNAPQNLRVILTTTTSSPSFPADYEDFPLTGTQPLYETPEFTVESTTQPSRVIQGDGILTLQPGQSILARYEDGDPAGGVSTAVAQLSCSATFQDQGYFVTGGCDLRPNPDPSDPNNSITPDQFIDADEVLAYTVLFANTSALDLTDVQVTMSPADNAGDGPELTVIGDNPVFVGRVPSGRRASAKFLVQGGDVANVQGRERLDIEFCIYSPADNISTPYCFTQTQTLEADFQTYRYSTRDPRGTLWGLGQIEEFLGGNENNPNDYRQFDDMTVDPGQDGDYGTADDVPSPNAANIPDPWDFNDNSDGFVSYPYDNPPVDGVTDEWVWSTAGGCGWETQWDVAGGGATGTGIFHSGTAQTIDLPAGAIGIGNVHPQTPPATPNQGPDPNFDSIDQAPNNQAPRVCSSYVKKSAVGSNYPIVVYNLKPPPISKVTSSTDFTVNFQLFRWYQRMDGHTLTASPQNHAVAVWLVHNTPLPPGGSLNYQQWEYGSAIYTDDVDTSWTADNNWISDNLSRPDPTFPDLNWEEYFGPAGESWDVMFSWQVRYQSNLFHTNQYGWGMDDVAFEWTESRERDDATDCNQVYTIRGTQPIVFLNSQRYSTCEGEAVVTVVDPGHPGLGTVQVVVSSYTEGSPGEFLTLTETPTDNTRYEGTIRFTTNPLDDIVGVLYCAAGQGDTAQGGDIIFVEYDPDDPDGDIADWSDNGVDGLPNTGDEGEGDGNIDDYLDNCTGAVTPDDDGDTIPDGDGIPDKEDDNCVLDTTCPTYVAQCREVFDFAYINCSVGGVYYVSHQLIQTAGDGDRYADHGELHNLKISLFNNTLPDILEATVVISTQDTNVCILDDSSYYGTILGAQQAQLSGVPAITTTPDDDLFTIGVPLTTRTTSLANIQKATIRVDIFAQNYSTGGDTYSAFYPLTFELPLDLDVQNAPAAGDFSESFEALSVDRFENPGWQNASIDARANDSFQHDTNGFCSPDCSACAIPADCEYAFDGTTVNNWHPTASMSYEGQNSYYFGKESTTSGDPETYDKGQYTAIVSPPIRLTNDPAVTPQLRYWQVVDFWDVFFTSGLNTWIGSGVLEIQPTNANPTDPSSWVRLYPIESSYNASTDALNACHTFFCNTHHAVFGNIGSFFTRNTGNGVAGKGTWVESISDLSDWKGQEVRFRWTVEVLQDLDITPGHPGWLVDDIRVTGTATQLGIRLENGDTDTLPDPCGLVCDYENVPAAVCAGATTQFVDRHTGLGIFNGPAPYPVEFRWDFNGDGANDLTCTEGSPVTPNAFLRGGDCDNPVVDITQVPGYGGPGTYFPRLQLFQNGALQCEKADGVLDVAAPLAADFTFTTPVLQGGSTFFTASTTGGASQTLNYNWDFDDGLAPFPGDQVQEYSFQNVGPHNVTLVVQDRVGGCEATVTKLVTVQAPPDLEYDGVVVNDAVCATSGNGQGDVDLNEFVEVEVSLINNGTTAATSIVGELRTVDSAVDIFKAASRFIRAGGTAQDPVAPGQQAVGVFSYIVKSPHVCQGSIPFTLDLFMNDRAVSVSLPITIPLGQSQALTTPLAGRTQAPPDNTNFICDYPGSASCPAQKTWDTNGTVPGTGTVTDLTLEVHVDMTGPIAQSNIDNIVISLVSPAPSSVSYDIYNGSARGQQTVDFIVTLSDPDSGSDPTDSPKIAPQSISAWRDQMFGVPAGGTWRLVIRDNIDSVATDTIAQTILQSWNLEVKSEQTQGCDDLGGPPNDPDACKVDANPPIFDGLNSPTSSIGADCIRRGVALSWVAAIDQEDFLGEDEIADRAPVHYLVYRSTTPGTLGTQLTPNPGLTSTTTYFDGTVTDGNQYCYTVLAADDRTPANVEPSAPVASRQRCVTYSCANAPGEPSIRPLGTTEPFIRLVDTGGGRKTVEIELCATCTSTNATFHRLYRGNLETLRLLPPTCDATLKQHFDHTVSETQNPKLGDCRDDGGATVVLRDQQLNAGTSGTNYYYLVVGVNTLGESPYGFADLDADGTRDACELIPEDRYNPAVYPSDIRCNPPLP